MQLENVDFVIDFKTTTDVFHSNRPDVLHFDHIIFKCRRLFYSHFTNSQVGLGIG